jgi:DNA (cytosine-5)-methyltransferase 1
LKLASLFDGIGGFPLAATMLGIEPVWASEIEKSPIAVTKESFPNMKHLGSVCDINGAEVEPVDIITFGSPCQDLSFAGKRAGMGEGTRSGLFSEAARIIKEMRDGTEKTFPRYAVWENVFGAFSSNHGEDFRAVIKSLAKVAEEAVSIPLPQDGKWEPAGLVEGDGWSIAWRTLDAQFWGVPQRRKRIFLVADFGGRRASEIFFEREGVSWNPAQSGNTGQETTGSVEGGVRATGFDGYNGAETGEQSATLGVNCGMSTGRNGVRVAGFKGGQGAKAYGIGYREEQSPTLGAEAATPTICCHATQDPITAENRSHALGANSSQVVYRFQRTDAFVEDSKGEPLAARDCKDGRDLVVSGCDFRNNKENGDLSGTLQAKANGGFSYNCIHPVRINQSVRRLTPLECERLQGFPDNWTNISGAFDSARYKALGNSVAIPCIYFILSCLRREE